MSEGNGILTKEREDAVREANRRRSTSVRREPDIKAMRYGPFGKEIVSIKNSATGYESANSLSYSGKTPARKGLSSDARTRSNLDQVRAESQEFDRDNCIYQAMITRVLDVVLGDGVTLQAKSANGRWNAQAEELWNEYWTLPEVRQMDSGCSMERKILRHWLVDGDTLIARTDSGLIQHIVADQIDAGVKVKTEDGYTVEQGIALDSLRKPVKFNVCQFDGFGNLRHNKATWIPAEACTFLANRRRSDATRGEPIMQSAFAMLHRISDVCDSEAAAWQLISRLAMAVIRKDAGQKAFGTSVVDTDADTSSGPISDRVHDIGTAIIFHGEPGEEVKGIERNMPAANFVESIKMFLRLLGLPLGFSLEFMLLIWSDTNYSSGRASIKQVERNTKPYRAEICRALCEIYRWKVAEWIKKGKLSERPDAMKHEWSFPPYPFIDPQKEAEARTESLKSGMTTPTREAKADGNEFPELVAEKAADLALVAAAVKSHNDKYPECPVDISDFIPRGDSSTALAQPPDNETPDDGNESPKKATGDDEGDDDGA